MYPTPASGLRRSPDEDDRLRRESKVAVNTQQIPPFTTARSPTQYLAYSPTNGTHPPSPFNQYASRPSTSAAIAIPSGISPRLGPPPSPKSAGPGHGGSAYLAREAGNSTFYDPTSEHREGQTSRSHSHYPTHSPVQVSSNRQGLTGEGVADGKSSTESRPSPVLRLLHRTENIPKHLPFPDRTSFSSAIAYVSRLACTPTEQA